jgi:hypothetical protein
MRRLERISRASYRSGVFTMFNLLEDGRLQRVAGEHRPDLLSAVRTHADYAVAQLDERSKTSGSGPAPEHPNNQLFFALMAYSLAPERTLILHPAVTAELARLRPTVDAARAADTTEFCVNAAAELVRGVSRFST